MDEDTKTMICAVLIVILMIMGIGVLDYLWRKNIYCPRFGKQSQLECNFDYFAGGCFVNYKGQWILAKNLRAGKLD